MCLFCPFKIFILLIKLLCHLSYTHVDTEISQNVWSWKFGFKVLENSWTPIGPHVYEPLSLFTSSEKTCIHFLSFHFSADWK